MHRKIEVKKEEKKEDSEKHILTAKTLSKAAEVNENLDRRGREIHTMMKKLCQNEKNRISKE